MTMTFSLKNLLLPVIFTPFLWSPSALAHVIWFEAINQQQHEILFGHPEESQPEPLVIEKFQEATAYGANQNTISHTTSFVNGRLFVNTTTTPSALTAFYDNGFWRNNLDGSYDNITREEAEAINFENVSQFVKYAKGLYAWNDTLAQPFGLPLEIRALANPLSLKEGDNLPIQVLFQGTLVNAPLVEYLGQTITVDLNGIALIPIGATGLQVIEASYTDPSSDKPVVSYAATFTAQSVPESGSLGLLWGVAILGVGKAIQSFNPNK